MNPIRCCTANFGKKQKKIGYVKDYSATQKKARIALKDGFYTARNALN